MNWKKSSHRCLQAMSKCWFFLILSSSCLSLLCFINSFFSIIFLLFSSKIELKSDEAAVENVQKDKIYWMRKSRRRLSNKKKSLMGKQSKSNIFNLTEKERRASEWIKVFDFFFGIIVKISFKLHFSFTLMNFQSWTYT